MTKATQITEYILELPFIKPPLSANDRWPHWAVKAKEVARVRGIAMLLARSKSLPKGLDHITFQLHYQPRDNRRRDESNLMPTQKALLDGLAAGTAKHPGYGLIPDDTREYVTETIPKIHPTNPYARGKDKQGRMWITITTTDPLAKEK